MARKPNTQAKGAAVKAAPEGEKLSGDLVIVTGPEGGRWRTGRQFGPTPVEIPVEHITEDEIKVLLDDPKLSVKPGRAIEPDADKTEEE